VSQKDSHNIVYIVRL